MSSPDLPIGIFDSGIGGLTVLSAVRRRLPHENLVYLGDTARVPYGTKSPDTIITYARRNIAFLRNVGVKAIVVACNTASALALEPLVQEIKIPLLGVVEPGAHRAVEATKSEKIGVIGTAATIASGAYTQKIHQMNSWITVSTKVCPLFVPLVEEGWTQGEIPQKIARHYLSDMVAANIDVLILGCTHYPLLGQVIQEVVGPKVQLIDSAEEVASSLAQLLESQGLLKGRGPAGRTKYYVTDAPDSFAAVGRRLVFDPITDITRVEV